MSCRGDFPGSGRLSTLSAALTMKSIASVRRSASCLQPTQERALHSGSGSVCPVEAAEGVKAAGVHVWIGMVAHRLHAALTCAAAEDDTGAGLWTHPESRTAVRDSSRSQIIYDAVGQDTAVPQAGDRVMLSETASAGGSTRCSSFRADCWPRSVPYPDARTMIWLRLLAF